MMLQQKDRITTHLIKRYQSWFGVRFEFLVYDVTSTYFEGQGGGAKAARGYSRDHRPDCKQVCIGLVATPEGLPLAFEVFAGNRNDVTTVEEIVGVMEQKYGQAERIWVMDRGMVSEDNVEFLRERKAYYVVGTPKAQLKRFEKELLDREGWQQVRPDVEVKLLEHPDGEGCEQFILCRSQARQEKEKAMLLRQERRLLQKLVQLDRALCRKPKALEEAGRRLGRWLGRYPAADKVFEIQILKNDHDLACGLAIASRLDRGQWTSQAQGAYLLRTNCTEKDPSQP
jgi:transposase